MSESNPYSAPSAELSMGSDSEYELQEPRAVGAGRGASWLGEGFEFFKQGAGSWVLICIVGFVIMMVLAFIPVVNLVTGLLTYVWVGGLMLGLQAQDKGEPIQVNHLFAGFSNNFGSLLLLGVVVTLVSFAIAGVFIGSVFWQMYSGSYDGAAIMDDLAGFMIGFLVMCLVLIPLMMATWFAPALIILHDKPIFAAMKMSFFGCLKNVLPFLIYGILATVVLILGSIPLMLGLLVVVPMLFGALYASYKDIFVY